MHSTILQSAEYLTQLADAEGQNIADAFLYGNYASYNVSVSRVLGPNVDTVAPVKALYDPTNVMALAGGWKV